MREQRIMNDNERKELESDVVAIKFGLIFSVILTPIIMVIILWVKGPSGLELYVIIVGMIIFFIILIFGGNWEARRIKKDIENGIVEVISGVVTKETKYKFRKYEVEINHENIKLDRPVYIDWLKMGNTIEIVRAPISKNICRVVSNGEEVYPFKSKQSNAADRSERAV